MSLIQVPQFSSSSAPVRSAALPEQSYVLAIASLPSYYAAAASSPSNAIHVFDKERLRNVQTLPGHNLSITSLRSVPNVANAITHALLSSGKDGTVNVWDERAGSAALRLTASTAGTAQGLSSCDVSADGLTIAAGTELHGEDASILYWDPRSPAAPLRKHSSTHSDDITALHFYRPSTSASSHQGNILLSASSDGLVCTTNADEPDEDEAGLQVGNFGCSVAQAGWLHDRNGRPGIWASSDMETFSVWTSELDRVHDVDIRQPSVHRQDLTWVTDYLIGCHTTPYPLAESDSDLCVFVGSNEGDVALITRPTFADPSAPWHLEHTWTNGHAGVVRAILWDEQNNLLLTGGEDSQLNAWTASLPEQVTSPGKIKREITDGKIKREMTDGEDSLLNAWNASLPKQVASPGKIKRENYDDPMDVDEGDNVRKKRRS